jgi:hypothetical protein
MTQLTGVERVLMKPPNEYDTAEQGDTRFDVLWLLLKEISLNKKFYKGKLYYTVFTTFI